MFHKILQKKWLAPVFFILIYFLSISPLRDFDIWFHLKSGELFSQHGILFKDVFSFSAEGRKWYPYEWLYQIFIYTYGQIFSFNAIKYITAIFYTFTNVVLFITVRNLFKIKTIYAFILSIFFLASTYEFYSARPQSIAYLIFTITVFLILKYYFQGKNYLLLSLPLTLIWANMHGSIFLGIALFIGFGAISLINNFLIEKDSWIKKSKTFFAFAFLNFVVSILPPLGFTQYQLLWKFIQDRALISTYISEWTPLGPDQLTFYIFSFELILILGTLLLTIIKTKTWKNNLWTLPFIGISFTAYLANRNGFLASISFTILLGWVFSKLNFQEFGDLTKKAVAAAIILFVGANIWLYNDKVLATNTSKFYYPVDAVKFIKNNLNGHMFNEYGYGGYLLYHLYPEKKVFIDGRTDVYLCCELPTLLNLAKNKYKTDETYGKFLYETIWDKYSISYVLIRTEKNTILRKVGRVLTNDPNWNLVFWDDFSEIFVRRDGKNNTILNTLETKAATPYERNPYRTGMGNQAFSEYQRMNQIVDSSKSRNAIGFIDLQKGKFGEAKDQFNLAIQKDPTNESPHMNLAELAAKDGDLNQAIYYYKIAQRLAPDRGLIYIRLGQLYLQRDRDTESAKKVWQTGVEQTIDTDAKKELKRLLTTI